MRFPAIPVECVMTGVVAVEVDVADLPVVLMEDDVLAELSYDPKDCSRCPVTMLM